MHRYNMYNVERVPIEKKEQKWYLVEQLVNEMKNKFNIRKVRYKGSFSYDDAPKLNWVKPNRKKNWKERSLNDDYG